MPYQIVNICTGDIGAVAARKYDIEEQQGYAYINIGNLHLYQKNHKDAISSLNNALDIANSVDNKAMISYCYLPSLASDATN